MITPPEIRSQSGCTLGTRAHAASRAAARQAPLTAAFAAAASAWTLRQANGQPDDIYDARPPPRVARTAAPRSLSLPEAGWSGRASACATLSGARLGSQPSRLSSSYSPPRGDPIRRRVVLCCIARLALPPGIQRGWARPRLDPRLDVNLGTILERDLRVNTRVRCGLDSSRTSANREHVDSVRSQHRPRQNVRT